MAEIQKRTKKDGTTTYTIRVLTGELNGAKVRTTRTVTPPAGLTEKKLQKWLQDEVNRFEDEAKGGDLATSNMTVGFGRSTAHAVNGGAACLADWVQTRRTGQAAVE